MMKRHVNFVYKNEKNLAKIKEMNTLRNVAPKPNWKVWGLKPGIRR
jgi:hypothetical protein